MVIYWHGLSCFKIETNDLAVGISPFAKNEKLGISRAPRFKSQILLLSSPEDVYSYIDSIDGQPMIFKTPGEFEVSGTFVYGIPGQAKFSKNKEKQNTIFVIKSEGLWLAHLGAFSGSSLPDEAMEKLEGVDVLMLPIGGGEVCDASQAASLVAQIEPKIVIPMHYAFSGSKIKFDSLEKFVKEINLKPEEDEKLSLKNHDPEAKMRLVILRSQSL